MIPECKLPDGRMRPWHDWPAESGPCRACGKPRGPGARPPSPEQEERIDAALSKGRPSRAIAEEVGVARSTVQRRKRQKAGGPAPTSTAAAKCGNCDHAAPGHAVACPADRRTPTGPDPIVMLADLLREAEANGIVMSFDTERSTALPCFACGAPPPHKLVALGRYPAGDRRGHLMERPLCAECRKVVGSTR